MKALFLASLLMAADAFAKDGKHLFILAGQSNMYYVNPKESFTPAVEAKFGKEHIIVVKNARVSRPIRHWDESWRPTEGQDPETIGDQYAHLLRVTKRAIAGQKLKSVTLLWMQGESDAQQGLGEFYAASFKRVLVQLKQDLGIATLNFVIARISDFDLSNAKFPHWTKLREVQMALADEDENGAWFDTDDLNDGLTRRGKEISNGLHYSAKGYKTLGARFAKQAIALLER